MSAVNKKPMFNVGDLVKHKTLVKTTNRGTGVIITIMPNSIECAWLLGNEVSWVLPKSLEMVAKGQNGEKS